MQTIKSFTPASNAKNYAEKSREMIAAWSIIGIREENNNLNIANIATVRWFMGKSSKASVVYCSLWISNGKEIHAGGNGQASGYGYCKLSASLESALNSAGFQFSREIVGSGKAQEALEIIANHFGYKNVFLTAHGW